MMLSSVAVEASNCAKLIQTYKENISGESQRETRALHKESEYRETWLQICFDVFAVNLYHDEINDTVHFCEALKTIILEWKDIMEISALVKEIQQNSRDRI